MDYKLTTDAETFLAYWSSIKNYDELPSEWVLQFRLAKVWAQPMDPLKAKLLKVSPGVRGIIAANVSAFVQEVYSDEEIAKLLATDADKKVIKPFLDGTWRLPGMTLEEGPNSQKQYESRTAILRVLPQLLKSEDADWVYSRAKVGDLFPDYVIAASRLDSVKGVKWLEKAIPDEPNQVSRCRMLVALGQVGGPDVQAYVVDHYYTDNKLEYNVGGLQEEFVNEVVKLPTEKARPLLRALVQDPRFATLGWSATRAFAENCQIFLGKKPAEADAYLAIDYPAGIYDFEQRVQDRKEHPKETERVLQATREFQRFLLKSLMPSGSP